MPTLKSRDNRLPPRRVKPNKAFYQSARWHKFSIQYRKANPLCAHCLKEGTTRIAEEVDHIIPISEGGEMWDLNNLQGLCKPHHSRKTRKEMKNRNEQE